MHFMENNEATKIVSRNQNQIAGAIVIAGLLIAWAILLKDSRGGENVAENKPNYDSIKVKPVSGEDHIRGNPNAKIVIVEYSDLECPFCKSFHVTMKEVLENNKDVAWVYRHFPIPALHQRAFKEAEATQCASEQGGNEMFWKYTDLVFERTDSNDSLDPKELSQIAKDLGLNMASFNECLNSGKFASRVEADIASGVEAGVTGTPSSIILKNGKVAEVIPGALPLQATLELLKKLK